MPLSLLLAEGETDSIFYQRVKDLCLGTCSVRIHNIGGLRNINKKILDFVCGYCRLHGQRKVRVYCCFDRESRYGTVPEFDLKWVRSEIGRNNLLQVLSVDQIIATQQIESWFFHDLQGIYEFLEVPKGQRRRKAYQPPEKYGYKDLQKLFERYGKTYSKGNRATHFISKLSLEIIVANCEELKTGIEMIRTNERVD